MPCSQPRERAEEAAGLADVGRLEPQVVVEVGARAVQPLALAVGQLARRPADPAQSNRRTPSSSVSRSLRPQFVVDLGQSGRVKARSHAGYLAADSSVLYSARHNDTAGRTGKWVQSPRGPATVSGRESADSVTAPPGVGKTGRRARKRADTQSASQETSRSVPVPCSSAKDAGRRHVTRHPSTSRTPIGRRRAPARGGRWTTSASRSRRHR